MDSFRYKIIREIQLKNNDFFVLIYGFIIEFAYNHGASKAKPYGVAYCLNESDEARVPFVYHTFELTHGVPAYWHFALNTRLMDRQLKKMVSSGARMDGLLNINYDTYMDVDINVPCLEEQQKIASFFSDLDEVISASEEEVAALEKQKKGAMQKIFSQEVRFKKDDGSDYPEWEEKRLGDVCEFVKTHGSGNNYVGTENMLQNFAGADLDTERTGSGITFSIGDTLMSNIRPYLKKVWTADCNGICSTDVLVFRPVNIRPEFLYCIIASEDFITYVMSGAKGTKMPRGDKVHMMQKITNIPCPEEQQKIADFLSNFDTAIDLAKQELEKWKLLKKGLLQQMFV